MSRHRSRRPPPVGRPLRHLLADPRWTALSLAARAAWVQLSVAADTLPALRAPADGSTVDIGRLLAASPEEIGPALALLAQYEIIETTGDGALIRLKAY